MVAVHSLQILCHVAIDYSHQVDLLQTNDAVKQILWETFYVINIQLGMDISVAEKN